MRTNHEDLIFYGVVLMGKKEIVSELTKSSHYGNKSS